MHGSMLLWLQALLSRAPSFAVLPLLNPPLLALQHFSVFPLTALSSFVLPLLNPPLLAFQCFYTSPLARLPSTTITQANHSSSFASAL
jgi:hypothetical protein